MKFLSKQTQAKLITTAAIALFSTNLQADTLGLYVSAGSWSPDISGFVSDNGENINVEDELGFDDDSSNVFSVALEHPVFMLPNIKIQQTGLDVNASSVLGSEGKVIPPKLISEPKTEDALTSSPVC